VLQQSNCSFVALVFYFSVIASHVAVVFVLLLQSLSCDIVVEFVSW